MGLRHRSGFDGVNVPREDQNLTKYDEKFILPTEPSNGYREAPAPNPLFPASGAQSAATPDTTDHNYVFGRRESVDGRASVFGGGNTQGFSAQQSMFNSDPTQSGFNAAPAQNGFNAAPAHSGFAATGNGGFSQTPTVQSERPMVFMLRDDPDMYVYEYSDRLEYFRRTQVGMVHCATKNKVKKY